MRTSDDKSAAAPREASPGEENRCALDLRRLRAPRKTTVFAFLAGACCGLAPAALDWFNPGRPWDRGGDVGTYLQRIVASSGQPHVIAGDCMSACPMWLGHKGTCVTPDALLYFHGASTDQFSPSPVGNAVLLSMYPPRVRAVVAPWLNSRAFHALTRLELARLGVPLCGGKRA